MQDCVLLYKTGVSAAVLVPGVDYVVAIPAEIKWFGWLVCQLELHVYDSSWSIFP